jgi:hypothetical protein
MKKNGLSQLLNLLEHLAPLALPWHHNAALFVSIQRYFKAPQPAAAAPVHPPARRRHRRNRPSIANV